MVPPNTITFGTYKLSYPAFDLVVVTASVSRIQQAFIYEGVSIVPAAGVIKNILQPKQHMVLK